MPLSDTDLNTLTAQIIARYELTAYPDSTNTVKDSLVLADLSLETHFASFYLNTLTSATMAGKLFIKARIAYTMCLLFQDNFDYWDRYQKAQNVNLVQNSAGSKVQFDTAQSGTISISDFCNQFNDLMSQIGAIDLDKIAEADITASNYDHDLLLGNFLKNNY